MARSTPHPRTITITFKLQRKSDSEAATLNYVVKQRHLLRRIILMETTKTNKKYQSQGWKKVTVRITHQLVRA
jgi:hypothetical protein